MDDLEVSPVEAEINEEETTVDEPVVQDKRPSSVVKLLHQRKELKNENEQLKAQLSDTANLAKKVAEMEEMLASQTLDQEAKQQKTEFFTKNPQAKEYETEIDKLVESK